MVLCSVQPAHRWAGGDCGEQGLKIQKVLIYEKGREMLKRGEQRHDRRRGREKRNEKEGERQVKRGYAHSR